MKPTKFKLHHLTGDTVETEVEWSMFATVTLADRRDRESCDEVEYGDVVRGVPSNDGPIVDMEFDAWAHEYAVNLDVLNDAAFEQAREAVAEAAYRKVDDAYDRRRDEEQNGPRDGGYVGDGVFADNH